MKKFFFLLLTLLVANYSFSQGIIRGKVSDKTGETLIGVPIVLKSNRSVGVTTDLDGNYSLKIKDTLEQTLIVSYVSYQTVEYTIHPHNGEIIIKDFVLESASKDLGVVEVVAKATRSNNNYMENLQKNSANTLNYISAETMKKIGDPNVTAAVARVSGVSTSGGFITVRGIGDRYVKTTINGSRIPTLDPFTNNIKLDLFPASLVDNIVITKTASPELPGDWAGAYLSIETKDYPDQLSINIESSFGYNSQSTFKEIVTSQHSSTDWLGYDNNFRDHIHENFAVANMNPTTYQEFLALGLGDYYKSIGVTGSTPWNDNCYKLGLIQLGLLAPANYNDLAAFTAAKTAYINGTYRKDAFNKINVDVSTTGKSFANNWSTNIRKAPLNFSQSFSVGDQLQLFGKPLGFIAGFRYGSSVQNDPSSTANRANYLGAIESSLKQEVTKETNGWSALVNLAYKLNSNNSFSLLFMPNYTGVNNVRSAFDEENASQVVVTKSQFYEQRKQMVYQFKSEHFLVGSKMKIEFNTSYTKGNSSAPDFKNLQYWKDPLTNQYQIGGTIGDGVHRYFRYLSDNLLDSRLASELPIFKSKKNPDLVRKLKFGAAYQENNKKSDQYDYEVLQGPDVKPFENGNLNQYFSLANFDLHDITDVNGYQNGTIDLYYNNINSPANHTFGYSKIAAGFAMIDYSLIPSLRIAGGLRIENAKIFTDVYKFNYLGYADNDPRRSYQEGVPLVNPGLINDINYLPSANIIYKLKNDSVATVNVRLNYSQTVARPSIRELSDVQNFDYEYRTMIFGNSELKSVQIKNYDLRLESYFNNGDNLSLSIFYKDFKNHIEIVNSGALTWENVAKSNVAGVEFEGKKIVTKHFDIRANVTLVNSKTTFVRTRMEVSGNGIKTYYPLDEVTHPMFGQSPYIINATATYTHDSLGFTAALSYNLQGPRLVIAAGIKEFPDIYELARHLVDFKITKKLTKHFNASITIRDILNSPTIRSYKGWNIAYDEYSYGTNYLLALSYKF